jgi:Holliday junction resolvase RusA-like endonuclease
METIYHEHMSRQVSFVVPGVPVAKARTRAVALKRCNRCNRTSARHQCQCGSYDFSFLTNIQVTPTKTVNYESLVRLCATAAFGDGGVLCGPLSFSAVCWFPVPKSRARKLTEGDPHTQRPDTDNVTKSLLDGCNGVLWADDCSVYRIGIEKRWTHGQPRAEVVIQEMNDE